MRPKPIRLFSRAAMMLLMMLLTTTAWAQGFSGITIQGIVKVNINGSGTVTLTHSGGTDVPVTSGTSYNVSGAYTLKFLPASGYEVNRVTLKDYSMVLADASDITDYLNGGSYTRQQIMGTEEYTVFFEKPGEPGAAIFYTLTSYIADGSTITFSVGGATVSTAKEGDRVDVTLSEPCTNGRWELMSNDVSTFTKDDATHFHFTMPGRNVIMNAHMIVQNQQEYTITDNSTHGHVNVGAVNGNDWDIETAMLTVEPDEGYEYEEGSLSATNLGTNEAIALTDQGNGRWTFTMPKNNVAVSATFTPAPTHFADNGDGSYTIKTTTGWDVFCDQLADNEKGYFTGKTVKLGADIGTAQNPITRMAGSSQHDFTGTFDGQGYTLYVNISSDNAHDYTAPFSYVSTAKANPSDANDSPAAIRNLNVAGTVTATKDYAGGIVGAFWGTLTIENCTSSVAISTDNKHAAGFIGRAAGNVTVTNCLSSVTINSSKEGDGTHAGFIGGTLDNKTFTIEGCAFTGKLLTTNGTTHCAGFVGYNSGTLNISNSIYAPISVNVGGTESATFARNWTMPADANCYYTATLGTAQGKQARSITAGENVSVGHSGVAKTYGVSGITAYKASDAHSDSDPFIAGIVYNNVLYAGSGDEVSLTLSNTADAPDLGYQYTYTANAGSLDGTTLTMPDQNVTVSLNRVVIDWATESTGEDLDHAYVIYNKDQLDLLAQRVNSGTGDAYAASGYSGKYFVLGANIEYSHITDWNDENSTENNYTPIGFNNGNITRSFNGTYDGQGHTISGIRIYKVADCNLGLFGWTDDADILGITLADARIIGSAVIGGIASRSSGIDKVSDCHVTADVFIQASHDAGGIVGRNQGTVSNCTSAATIIASYGCCGGIAGWNYGTVSNCTSTAILTAGSVDCGGIVGWNEVATLRNNLAIGAVVPATKDNSHGAICGRNKDHLNSPGILDNNYYYGCKVASNNVTATGVGCNNNDVTNNNGAVPAFLVTLNDGVTIETAMAAGLGFSYGGKNYWFTGTELTLVLPALPTDVPPGYARYAYTANGKEISGTTLTVGNQDITVKRTLIVDPDVGKRLTLATNGDGTVEMDECAGVTDNGDGTYAVLPGTTVTVKATPAAGSYFKNWNTETDINSNVAVTSTFTVTEDMTLTANFVAKPVLTLSADGNGTVDIQGFTYGEKTIIPNSSITLWHGGDGFADQGGDKLFDGIYTGDNKWCTESSDKYVEFYTSKAVKVNGYTLITGNDNSTCHGRNPKSWVLKAGSDGVNWTTIASVSNDNTMMDVDYTPYDFQMDVPGSYSYFRFEVSAVHNNDKILQLGELQLFYQEITPVEGVTQGATANTYILDYGTAITVKAMPAEGKCVRNWDNDDPIIPAKAATLTKTYTLTENTTATAHFASYHTLTAGADITVNGLPVSQGSTITVPTGATVVLTHDHVGYTAHYTVNTTAIDGGTFSMPDENVTIGATWTMTTYTITYELDGGDVATANPTSYNIETETFTLNNPTKPGYTFTGWTGSNGTTPETTVTITKGSKTEDLNYTANWTVNQYTISFDTNGGTPATIDAIKQDYDTPITAPANPTREGYDFAGWSPALPTTMPAGDMTVTAQWTPVTYTITYELDGGDVATANPTSYNIETETFTLNNPTKPGYTFTGWTGSNGTTPETTVTITKGSKTEDLNYTAHYEFIRFTEGDLSYEWTSATSVKVTACNQSATSVTIPATVSNLGVTYSVTAISNQAFYNCPSLESISVAEGNTVYHSEDNCLIETTSHTLILGCKNSVIPDGVTTIGVNAFMACTGLTSITIPASVTHIGNAAFTSCSGLESISVASGNPKFHSEGNCLIETASHTLIQGCKNSVIPDGVTRIGDAAFANFTSVTSIEIPASVTHIGDFAFRGCNSLTSIEIPASVTSIGDYAFSGCPGLTSVTIYAPSLSDYGADSFVNHASGRKIYVFNSCVNTYKGYASRMNFNKNDVQPIAGINLKDAADNSSLVAAADGNQLNVTLQGRTLTANNWNTLCLPFNLSSTQIESLFGSGTKVKTLSSYTNDGTTVTITYADATTIEAGKPYIVKPTNDVVNPVFSDVTISNTMNDVTVGGATFKGTYGPVALTANDKQKLFLANNTLWYPTKDLTVRTCRAYFELDADVPESNNAPSIIIDYGDATGILSIDHSPSTIDHSSDAWYTLDGRKLDGKPAKKGVYINKGRQVVIK